jgi:hypothetical protein
MMRLSSWDDHLLCFLAGDSNVCGGMLRFPPPLLGRELLLELGVGPEMLGALAPVSPAAPNRGDNGPVATAKDACGGPLVGAVDAAGVGAVLNGVCWVGDTGDSFESESWRREAISTMGYISPGLA